MIGWRKFRIGGLVLWISICLGARATALREYVPGNLIYANGHRSSHGSFIFTAT